SMILDVIEGRSAREGDVLVFLPGTREIRGVRERVQDRAARMGFETVELHGSLSLEDQDRAIKKSHASGALHSKIVLATNIAETSLTIDGIGTVIDSGLARVSRFDAAGFSRLQLSRISLASATQRSGRAGRQGPGISHRLWSKFDESSMSDFEQPEILRTDLTEPLMTLLAQGVRDPESFSWFEKPPTVSLRAALTTLDELGFRNPATGELTTDGREALKLPLPVRPARLVLEAARVGQVRLGSLIAALLTEKDIVLRSSSGADRSGLESDILVRFHKLNDPGARDVDRIAKQVCLRAAEQIERIASGLRLKPSSSANWAKGLSEDEIVLKLVLLGYPDRISRRRREGESQARMIGGKGVRLSQFSSVERSEFFISLDSMEPPPHAPGIKNEVLISLASHIERPWVEQFFSQHLKPTSEIVFDENSRSVLEQSALCLRDLPMTEPRVKRASVDYAHAVLVEACLENWTLWFSSREDIRALEDRVQFLRKAALGTGDGKTEAAVASTDGRAEAAVSSDAGFVGEESEMTLDENFRREFLEEACFGSTKLDEVLGKDLLEIANRHLPSGLSGLLRKEAPEKIEVPSGSQMKINYPEERLPYIEVRIQEIFGWTESPKLAKGRVPLQLHLLGPNYRPVQITSDLASFWKTGYPEVRKELRLR
ncbi:MAG: ATP-dependent helicase HrpB, partial [Proteobacteria bacterium]